MAKKRILSGVTPSNQLTLGNYIGALRSWTRLQHEYDCYFMVANMHSITIRQDPAELRERTYRAVANYVAAGIDPETSTLFIQSHVPEHAELAWVLTCHCYMGELNRMTQFKDKGATQGQNVAAGLFCYPALMASDILLYQADLVPVGDDQKQHIELTRDLAERLIHLYGEGVFKVPQPYIPPIGARIMSLQNPTAKMSKSDADPSATIYLSDTDKAIEKKIKRAVTDSGSEITCDDAKPGVKNLLTIQAAIQGGLPDEIAASYAGKQYGHLKVDTAAIVIETVRPIREKTEQLLADRGHLDALIAQGAERARAEARRTLADVYKRVGLL